MEKSNTLALDAKLIQIREKVGYLKKDGKGHNYKYVSSDQALEEIKPLLNELKIQWDTEIISTDFSVIPEYKTSKGVTTKIIWIVKMLHTLTDIESGESKQIQWAGSGENDTEKGFGSALTYGERYFLLKFFHINTGDLDPEKKEAQREQKTQRAKAQEPQKVELSKAELDINQQALDKFTSIVPIENQQSLDWMTGQISQLRPALYKAKVLIFAGKSILDKAGIDISQVKNLDDIYNQYGVK